MVAAGAITVVGLVERGGAAADGGVRVSIGGLERERKKKKKKKKGLEVVKI